MPADPPFSPTPDGVTVRVRLTPRAAADRIAGLYLDADGKPAIKATVTAPPEGGKANSALIRLLAKTWRLPRTAIAVSAGATDRNKTLFIAGDAQAIMERLAAWMEEKGWQRQG